MRASALTRPALALLFLTAAARAETTAPAAAAAGPAPSPHLAAAQRLYQRLDLEAALAELREAEMAAKDNEDETVQILIYRGLIFSETGKVSDAQKEFKRALAMRPWAEVPADTSPRLAKIFGDARKELWGSGGQIKPPPKKRGATAASPTAMPASATGVQQKAVPATATMNEPSAAPATTQAAPAAPNQAPSEAGAPADASPK